MIKNIIFDIGNVLVSFKPEIFLHELFDDPDLRKKLHSMVFCQEEWVSLDKGTLLLEEARLSYLKKCPELTEAINLVISNLFEKLLLPIPENIDLLKDLKKQGYAVYLLSNYHLEAFEYINSRLKLTNFTDGQVISAHVKLLKPDQAIFQFLLTKYHLKPEETVFIDDCIKNVEAAKKQKINVIHYQDHEKLKSQLQILFNQTLVKN